MLDDDFTVDATLAEGGAIWSPPRPTPADASHDYLALYERERARAEAAEGRCEELRWAEVAARSEAGSWKSRFKCCRSKLDAAVEETKKLRREVKAGAPGLHREVTRLRKELSQALAEPSAAATQARKDRIAALEAENHPTAQDRAHSGEPQGDDSGGSTARLFAMLRSFGDCATTARRSGHCPRSSPGYTCPWRRPSM